MNSGKLKCVVKSGTIVELWFQSPSGDHSDSIIANLPCVDEQQAQEVFEAWSNEIQTLRNYGVRV